MFYKTGSPVPLHDALALIDQSVMTLSAFRGIGVEKMIRGPEWHCLDTGCRLERAARLATLLHHTLVHGTS